MLDLLFWERSSVCTRHFLCGSMAQRTYISQGRLLTANCIAGAQSFSLWDHCLRCAFPSLACPIGPQVTCNLDGLKMAIPLPFHVARVFMVSRKTFGAKIQAAAAAATLKLQSMSTKPTTTSINASNDSRKPRRTAHAIAPVAIVSYRGVTLLHSTSPHRRHGPLLAPI